MDHVATKPRTDVATPSKEDRRSKDIEALRKSLAFIKGQRDEYLAASKTLNAEPVRRGPLAGIRQRNEMAAEKLQRERAAHGRTVAEDTYARALEMMGRALKALAKDYGLSDGAANALVEEVSRMACGGFSSLPTWRPNPANGPDLDEKAINVIISYMEGRMPAAPKSKPQAPGLESLLGP